VARPGLEDEARITSESDFAASLNPALGLCVVRAKPIAHPEAHQEYDEKVDHTDLMQGLHVLTC
jgi:hypothetical protein